ncbi:MAG: DUF2628 domain-containing protein [Rhodospirillales bacterium]|nr:DUF2628 domain-containing protein [Rhodospirillales bacterium]
MKTRLFTVHLLDDLGDDGLVLVKDGFCWPAFFVAVPWALFHRMWLIAALIVVLHVFVGVSMTVAGFNEVQQGIVSFMVAVALGFSADEIRRWVLSRRGYSFEDVVVEENADRATRRFLDERPDLAVRLAGGTL